MSLSLKHVKWPIELILIMVFFSLINLVILIIGYKDISTIIICQTINLIGFIVLLSISIVHIHYLNHDAVASWFHFIKKRIYIIDFLLIVLLIVFSNFSYRLMTKIGFVEVFNISLFRGFVINNVHGLELKIVVILFFIVVTVGVFAEELYFRAYLFEKQSKYFKSYTWIINGFSWSIYHLFSPTNFIAFLPACLFYSYCYQKRRNIWITILAHLISNYMILYLRMRPLLL